MKTSPKIKNTISQLTNLDEEEPPGSLSCKGAIKNLKELNLGIRLGGSFFVTLPSELRNFYLKHGYSSSLKNLSLEIVANVNQCFELWEEFSPQKSLFDTWEFRLAFYKSYKDKPYFIVLKNKEENIGLLPLWYEKEKKKYFWFGSWWQEDNKFFAKEPIFIPLMLTVCPKPMLLNAIKTSELKKLGPARKFIKFQKDDSKYVLDLTKIKTLDDYLMSLKKNRRHNLRKDKRRIEKQNPQVIVDNFSDFDHLVRLSKERFTQKGEDTDWEDPKRVETFRNVINLAGKSYKVRMITVKIGEKIAGVDLITIFNDCYYAIKCGYDVKDFSGIGNFVNLFEIEDALRLGLKKIDFLQNNYDWKERLFESIPLLKYEE